MRINTNVMAINAQRNLTLANMNLAKSVEKLSSGLRINRAADDAAGLTISEKLRAQVRGLQMANRNAQDAVSLVQTAEGALQEVTTILQRMRELAVQAATSVLSTSDRTAIKAELDQLRVSLDGIADQTKFNNIGLLNQAPAVFTVQVGANPTELYSFSIGAVTSLVLSVDALQVNGLDNATFSVVTIDAALSVVAAARSRLGAAQNALESTIRNLGVAIENLAASESRVRDLDVAEEMVRFTKNQIIQQAGTAVLAQANTLPQSVLSLLR
jgi:flagellin